MTSNCFHREVFQRADFHAIGQSQWPKNALALSDIATWTSYSLVLHTGEDAKL